VSVIEALVEPSAIVTLSIVGALANTIEVAVVEDIALDWLDGFEVPTELVAVTTNVYGLTFGMVAPDGCEKVIGLLVPLTLKAVATPPMNRVAVYEVIGADPELVGGVKETL
jgi:hypothetical protein